MTESVWNLIGGWRRLSDMRMPRLVVGFLLLAAACGNETDVPRGGAATTTAPTSSSTTTVPAEGLLVVVTGAVTVDADGDIEICPGLQQPCAGIRVGAEPEVFSHITADDPAVFSVTGRWDGTALTPTQPPQHVDDAFDTPDYSTPCQGLEGAAGMNPPEGAVEAVNEYAATIPELFAGLWWDSQARVVNVWLVGDDVDVHRTAIEAAVPEGAALCVFGGARFSEAHLEDLMDGLGDAIDIDSLVVTSWGLDTLDNRVEVSAEYVDPPAREALDELGDGAIDIRAFIEVLEGTVADLPDPMPARPGNVPLPTQRSRGGVGMDALGRFEIHFDPELGCVYANEGSDRAVLVWPFGYTAESGPLRIYDYDGRLVAEEGDLIEAGGGGFSAEEGGPTPAEVVEPDLVCGADTVWIMNGPPRPADA